MPEMSLNAGDAAELAETLQVLSDWLARDARHPGAPLAGFAGHRACDTRQLRTDLDRFVFLPAGNNCAPWPPRPVPA